MNSLPAFKKTRLAPTPNYYMHIGNVLSFAITAALAKRTGAKIMLRIDDFDRERTNKLYVQDIFDTLNFLEIPWDEGPRNWTEFEQEYSQRHREHLYTKALLELRDGGHVFACTCSRTQVHREQANNCYDDKCREANIPFDAPNVSWRLNTAIAPPINVNTLQGPVTATITDDMRDFIVRKKDGHAAYQLISVIDDAYYGVDLVVRGQDLWPSTIAQHYLSALLPQDEMNNMTFHHHPLIMGHDGNKLAKSEEANSVHHLRMEHKTRQDVFSAIAASFGMKGEVSNWEDLVTVISQ